MTMPGLDLSPARMVGGRAVIAPKAFELPYEGVARPTAGDRPLTFGIRPEDVMLESGAPIAAKVHDVENHGVEKIVTLRIGETTLRATVPASTDVELEQDVRFAWNPRKVALFDRSSGLSLRHVS